MAPPSTSQSCYPDVASARAHHHAVHRQIASESRTGTAKPQQVDHQQTALSDAEDHHLVRHQAPGVGDAVHHEEAVAEATGMTTGATGHAATRRAGARHRGDGGAGLVIAGVAVRHPDAGRLLAAVGAEEEDAARATRTSAIAVRAAIVVGGDVEHDCVCGAAPKIVVSLRLPVLLSAAFQIRGRDGR